MVKKYEEVKEPSIEDDSETHVPSESESKPEQNLVIDLTRKAKSKNAIDMQNVLGYLD